MVGLPMPLQRVEQTRLPLRRRLQAVLQHVLLLLMTANAMVALRDVIVACLS
jgi:hypothetical protein